MLIGIEDSTGLHHFINTERVDRISEAEPACRYHGIKTIITTAGGYTIECRNSLADIQRKIAEQQQREGGV